MTNRFFAALAMAGLISVAACGNNDEVRVEDPAVAPTTEEPVLTPAPEMEPAPPVTTEPMPEDTLLLDDTVPPTDATGAPVTPPTNP